MANLNPHLKSPAALELGAYFEKKLKGQPQVIKALAQAYASFKSGIRKFDDQGGKRPIGIFLLLGPSRTGKTETGRVLAEFFHGTKKALTLIDCVSYQEKHEIAKLIGAPPGYIGYDQKPLLSKEKLYSRLPGYQTKSAVDGFKSNKKEELAKEEDDDSPETKDILYFWLNRLNLIEEALTNIDRKFSHLRNMKLSPPELQEVKEDLKIQRNILQTSRDYILIAFTELSLQVLENLHQTPTPLLGGKKGGNSSVIKKIKTAPNITSKSIPVEVTSQEEPILILIFDEIEKAHETIRQFLLQLMEEGRAVLGNGEEVDLSRAFIILTSNLGSKLIGKATKGVAKIGFSSGKINLEKLVKAELKKLFSQEFINRLDAIITFNILSPQNFKDIMEMHIEDLSLFLAKVPLKLEISQPVKDFILVETAKNPEEQAKSLHDCFKKYLLDPISNLLGTGQLSGKKHLMVVFEKNEIIFKT